MLILTSILSIILASIVMYFVITMAIKATISKDIQYSNALLGLLLESKGIGLENIKTNRQKLSELILQKTRLDELKRDHPEQITEQEHAKQSAELTKKIDDIKFYRSIRVD